MADLETVEMVHPGIEGTVTVPRMAFEHFHVRTGWRLADPPDQSEEVRQILLQGGMEPAEADRVVAAAYPPEESPPAEEPKQEAPADAGASSSPDADEQPPRRRRASSKEEGAE